MAAHFSEPVARRSGVTCLHLLLIYKKAAGIEVNHAEPFGTPIEVPNKKGELTTKPFSQCSVAELRLAIQHKRKPASIKPLPAEVRAQVEAYMKGVHKRIPKLPGFRMQLRNDGGTAVIDLKSIPLPEMCTLAEALIAEFPLEQLPRKVNEEPRAE